MDPLKHNNKKCYKIPRLYDNLFNKNKVKSSGAKLVISCVSVELIKCIPVLALQLKYHDIRTY